MVVQCDGGAKKRDRDSILHREGWGHVPGLGGQRSMVLRTMRAQGDGHVGRWCPLKLLRRQVSECDRLVNLVGVYGVDVCLKGTGKPLQGLVSDTGDKLLSRYSPFAHRDTLWS